LLSRSLLLIAVVFGTLGSSIGCNDLSAIGKKAADQQNRRYDTYLSEARKSVESHRTKEGGGPIIKVPVYPNLEGEELVSELESLGRDSSDIGGDSARDYKVNLKVIRFELRVGELDFGIDVHSCPAGTGGKLNTVFSGSAYYTTKDGESHPLLIDCLGSLDECFLRLEDPNENETSGDLQEAIPEFSAPTQEEVEAALIACLDGQSSDSSNQVLAEMILNSILEHVRDSSLKTRTAKDAL
jgi:hypothetical protein